MAYLHSAQGAWGKWVDKSDRLCLSCPVGRGHLEAITQSSYLDDHTGESGGGVLEKSRVTKPHFRYEKVEPILLLEARSL